MSAEYSIPGPNDISRRELSNGITVLVRENHSNQSVVFSGLLMAGSALDGWEKAGLAGFATSALMRGTATRDFEAIHETIESIGASLSIRASVDNTIFGGKCLAEDLGVLLELLADILRNPSFPEDQVERLRGEIITALDIRAHDTRQMAALTFAELAYPREHPYSRSVSGYRDTIRQITIDDLRDYHAKSIGPRGMIIVIVGAVKAENAVRLVEKSLGDWQNPAQREVEIAEAVPKITEVRRKTVEIPGKSQSDIVLGVPGPSRYHPKWLAAQLGNSILGQFGLYGRLGESVREKQGLAYYSFSQLEGGPGPGAWKVIAGVNPANVELAINTIVDEIRRFVSEPVTDEELSDNKSNFTGRLPLLLETNAGVASSILSMERYNLGLDYLQRYADLVNSITAQDILEVANEYLNPDAYALAVAGPGADSR